MSIVFMVNVYEQHSIKRSSLIVCVHTGTVTLCVVGQTNIIRTHAARDAAWVLFYKYFVICFVLCEIIRIFATDITTA